jgi:serine protease inhibitor
LAFTYSKMKVPKELIRSEHQRGIYFSPLYDKTYEFLRGEVKEKDLTKAFDTSYDALVGIWKEKHARGRIKQLTKQNKVSYDTLFYDDLIYLSWQETKDKYLPQVGR